MMHKNKSLVTKTDTQVSLKKASSLLSITDKILQRSNLAVLDDGSWLDRLIEWADKKEISEDCFPRNKEEIRHLKILNLQCMGLSELPPEIGDLQKLQCLYLDMNILTALPPEIGRLHSLQKLYASRNKLSKLPPEIGKLQNLHELELDMNQLSEVPPEIGELRSLVILDLSFNSLNKLPPEIGKLQNLEDISLGMYAREKPYELPFEMSEISTLKKFDNDLKEPNESTKEFIKRCTESWL